MTLQSLADTFRMSPQGVRRWFGSTDVMWQRIAGCTGRRWVQWIVDARRDPHRQLGEPVRLACLLPFTEEERAWTRVWLAIVDLGRTDAQISEIVAHWEQEEVQVAALLDPQLAGDQLQGVMAQVRGLRHRLCGPGDPLPIDEAHRLLASYVALLGFDGGDRGIHSHA